MSYSKADLRNRVMKDAGVLDIAESASASDAANVDEVIQQSIEELEVESLAIFNPLAAETIDNIPGRVFLPLAAFVQSQGLSSYGVPRDEELRMSALRRLRRAILPSEDDVPVKSCYF